jgi:hypothetical protein
MHLSYESARRPRRGVPATLALVVDGALLCVEVAGEMSVCGRALAACEMLSRAWAQRGQCGGLGEAGWRPVRSNTRCERSDETRVCGVGGWEADGRCLAFTPVVVTCGVVVACVAGSV